MSIAIVEARNCLSELYMVSPPKPFVAARCQSFESRRRIAPAGAAVASSPKPSTACARAGSETSTATANEPRSARMRGRAKGTRNGFEAREEAVAHARGPLETVTTHDRMSTDARCLNDARSRALPVGSGAMMF
jgi:hypothetical protein